MSRVTRPAGQVLRRALDLSFRLFVLDGRGIVRGDPGRGLRMTRPAGAISTKGRTSASVMHAPSLQAFASATERGRRTASRPNGPLRLAPLSRRFVHVACRSMTAR
jgi:hypothetical protein